MSTVLIDRSENVVTLTLNRPDRRNGVTEEMVEELVTSLEGIGGAVDDRVLVLRGRGDAFCSGMDLGSKITDPLPFMQRVGRICTLLHDVPIPTIAAVRGPALGFGGNLALCCDLVLADDSAVFGEIFAERGLTIDGGGSWSLPRRIGLTRAKEIVFFARRVTGQEAADLGLINKVTTPDELDRVVDEWSVTLAQGPRRALGVMKSLLNEATYSSFDDAVRAEVVAQALSFFSREAREGVQAFLEQRPPNFTDI